MHDRVVHGGQLIFDAGALEQRNGVGILLYPAHMARHQQTHEVLRGAIAFLALDDDFLDILVIDIADRPLDEVAIIVDQFGRGGLQRLFANLVPKAGEIVEVALDFRLGALKPGGADDAAHGRRQRHFGNDRLQPLAVGRVADLARNTAAMAGIRHQHAIATGERQIGGQRRALVAAFFLDDLDQQHLTALDNVLNLVAAAQRHALAAQFLGRVIAGLAATTPVRATAFGRFALGGFAFWRAIFIIVVVMGRLDDLDALAILVLIVEVGAQCSLFLGMLALFAQQGFAVFAWDLIIVGVDFAESKETVTVAAIIDKRGLERRLDPRHLG